MTDRPVTRTVTRLFRKPNGKTKRVEVALCTCRCHQRGPLGGMCITCHGAITSVEEQRAINTAVWEKELTLSESRND